jgi:hypothetical protein
MGPQGQPSDGRIGSSTLPARAAAGYGKARQGKARRGAAWLGLFGVFLEDEK